MLAALIGVLVAHCSGHNGVSRRSGANVDHRCHVCAGVVHPPWRAVALTAVLGGEAVQQLGLVCAARPGGSQSLLLLLIGLLFNMAAALSHRRWTRATRNHTRDPAPNQRLGVQYADLDAILSARVANGWISTKTICARLYSRSSNARLSAAFRRDCCADITSRDIYEVTPQTPMGEVWQLLQQHHIKAVPWSAAMACCWALFRCMILLPAAWLGRMGVRSCLTRRGRWAGS